MKNNKPRELTEKEKQRTEKFNTLCAQMENEGYRKTDLILSIKNATSTSIILWLVYSLIFGILYSLRNKLQFGHSFMEITMIIIIVLVLIVVHELIHAITWSFFVKNNKSIEFGFVPQKMAPYCTCSEPVAKIPYVLVSFMPCLLLGIIPTIIAIFINSSILFSISNIMVLGAGGDISILLKLLAYKSSAKEQLFVDHPTEGGCVIFEK